MPKTRSAAETLAGESLLERHEWAAVLLPWMSVVVVLAVLASPSVARGQAEDATSSADSHGADDTGSSSG